MNGERASRMMQNNGRDYLNNRKWNRKKHNCWMLPISTNSKINKYFKRLLHKFERTVNKKIINEDLSLY